MSSEPDSLTPDRQRKKLIKKIEELRELRLVVYVSRAPLDDEILIPFYQELKQIGYVPRLDLFLHSYGGAIDTPYKIIKLMRTFCDEFTVIVPFAAKSAASMIALGADHIVMSTLSELGPIDPLVKHPLYPEMWVSVQALHYCFEYLDEIISSSPQKSPTLLNAGAILRKIDPWLLGDYRKTVKASQQYAERLLGSYMLKDRPSEIKPLVDQLLEGYFSHGYPIGLREAQELGLNIIEANGELASVIWELFLAYEKLFQDLEN